MKRILFICASILDEAGALHVFREAQLRLLLKECAAQYGVTVLVQAKREKTCQALQDIPGVRVIYDSAPMGSVDVSGLPTRTQQQYLRFASCAPPAEEYDWAIAWEGLSPYGLATLLRRASARSKAAMVLEQPELFLLPEDRAFLFQAFSQLAGIYVPTDAIRRALTEELKQPLFDLPARVELFDMPVDTEAYQKLAGAAFENPYEPGQVNLLALARMTTESPAERLPEWIAKRKQQGENVHCYLLGNGPRKQRYQYQIAVWDVDDCFTLLGEQENPYPLLRHCDGVFLPDEDSEGPLHEAAELFQIPILSVDQ